MVRMEDYFDWLQKAAARNAARKDEASNGRDNLSNHEPKKEEGPDDPDSVTQTDHR